MGKPSTEEGEDATMAQSRGDVENGNEVSLNEKKYFCFESKKRFWLMFIFILTMMGMTFCVTYLVMDGQQRKKAKKITENGITENGTKRKVAPSYNSHMYFKFPEHEVKKYCETKDCEWTKEEKCPWDKFGESENWAEYNNDVAYYSCCVSRLHVEEECGFSDLNKSNININKPYLFSQFGLQRESKYCDYVCLYKPRDHLTYDACTPFFEKYGTCANKEAQGHKDETVGATYDCCCDDEDKRIECGSVDKPKFDIAKVANYKYDGNNLFDKEKSLTKQIDKFCQDYDIIFHFAWGESYDKDHLLPFLHVVPDQSYWYFSNSHLGYTKQHGYSKLFGYPGRFGFQKGDIRPMMIEPSVKFSEANKNDVYIESNLPEGTHLDNRFQVTHGIDEDKYWCGEAYKDKENFQYPFSLTFSQYANKQRLKAQTVNKDIQSKEDLINIKDKEGNKIFTEKKKFILFITTNTMAQYSSAGDDPKADCSPSVICNKIQTDDFKENMQTLSTEYNVILRHHPLDLCVQNYREWYGKICVQPDVHWQELSKYVDAVVVEASGATFASMPNWIEKPVVFMHRQNGGTCFEDYEKHKDDALSKKQCVICLEDENIHEKIKTAFEEFEKDDKRNAYIKARKEHFKKLFGFDVDDIKQQHYNEYRIIIDILKNLNLNLSEAKSKKYHEKIKELTTLFDKLNEE